MTTRPILEDDKLIQVRIRPKNLPALEKGVIGDFSCVQLDKCEDGTYAINVIGDTTTRNSAPESVGVGPAIEHLSGMSDNMLLAFERQVKELYDEINGALNSILEEKVTRGI